MINGLYKANTSTLGSSLHSAAEQTEALVLGRIRHGCLVLPDMAKQWKNADLQTGLPPRSRAARPGGSRALLDRRAATQAAR